MAGVATQDPISLNAGSLRFGSLRFARGGAASCAVRWIVVLGLCSIAWPGAVAAGPLDEMPVERWAKLRETERHQLNIAEKYYREQNWKIALDEYQKFLTLYETSEGAPFAQLKWSLCQVKLRKLNTAIKDGFQNVLDYWPDAPEAGASAYFIARTYKDMGEIKPAKGAYAKLLTQDPNGLTAILARHDLVEIAAVEKDEPRRLALLKELVFSVPRSNATNNICAEASLQLARHHFYAGEFEPGKGALAATWKDRDLAWRVFEQIRGPVHELTAHAERKALGEQAADAAVKYLKDQEPPALDEPAAKERAKELHYWMAEIEAYARRPERVRAIYEAMEKRFGTDDGLLQRQADWFKGQNRRPEARAVFARFADPIAGGKQLAWMDREDRQFDAALLKYQDLIARDPGNTAQYQWQMAETQAGAGRLKEAIALYRQCDTSYPENLKRMAWHHRELKEFGEALTLYAQVAGNAGSAPWAMLQIAHTQEQSGAREKAIKAYQQVCRQFPKSGEAGEAHAHLQTKYKISITLGGTTED